MPPTVLTQGDLGPFTEELFDPPEQARKAALILKGILGAPSRRTSDISQALPGSPQAHYKAIQHFSQGCHPRDNLLSLFDEQAPFVLADPTEIPRQQAKKTLAQCDCWRKCGNSIQWVLTLTSDLILGAKWANM